jgi:undecaprenyl-diphosphatase
MESIPGTGQSILQRMQACDASLCLLLNRAARRRLMLRAFALISRLGDGVFWYALMAVLPVVDGRRGTGASLHMAAVGLVGVALYKLVKRRVVRQRPFVTQAGIVLGTPPLDRYSFPSGHTLHAVSFTVVALAYYPTLAWMLFPFAVLVALSRPALGLHYPSDVLAGAGIGATLGQLSLIFS